MTQTYQFHLIIQGAGLSQVFNVPLGITIIGRQAGSGLLLEHPLISRHHAQLAATLTECELADLGSANGTYLNGNKLDPNVPLVLRPGDAIQMGPFTLTFQQEPVEEAAGWQPEEPPLEGTEPIAQEPAPVETPAEPLPEASPPVDEEPALDALSDAAPFGFQAAEPAPAPFEMVPGGLSIESQQLLRFLPGVYLTDFMSRFLGLFESILLPIEWNIDNFDIFLDPDLSPAEFLPWLANWFGVLLQPDWSEAQRREFLRQAGEIYARRGTRPAMQRILKIFTGSEVEIDDSDKSLPPFTFRVRLPVRKEAVNLAQLSAIIDANKPAYTSYILVFNK